jgi:hypothetical protein
MATDADASPDKSLRGNVPMLLALVMVAIPTGVTDVSVCHVLPDVGDIVHRDSLTRPIPASHTQGTGSRCAGSDSQRHRRRRVGVRCGSARWSYRRDRQARASASTTQSLCLPVQHGQAAPSQDTSVTAMGWMEGRAPLEYLTARARVRQATRAFSPPMLHARDDPDDR